MLVQSALHFPCKISKYKKIKLKTNPIFIAAKLRNKLYFSCPEKKVQTLTEQQLHQWRYQRIHPTGHQFPASQFPYSWHKEVEALLLPVEIQHRIRRLTVKGNSVISKEHKYKEHVLPVVHNEDLCTLKKEEYLNKSSEGCCHNSKDISSIKSWRTPLQRIWNSDPGPYTRLKV